MTVRNGLKAACVGQCAGGGVCVSWGRGRQDAALWWVGGGCSVVVHCQLFQQCAYGLCAAAYILRRGFSSIRKAACQQFLD